jgi:hypothetical protein
MKLSKQMRKLGQISFIVLCIVGIIFFIGMVSMPEGGYDLDELPPLVRIAFVIGAVLFIPTLVLLLGSNVPRVLANRALQANGLPAEAHILKVWQTGMRINRNPVVRMTLEVRPPNQPSFQAETERMISTLQIIDVRPGMVVPVKYNPETLEVALAE